MPFVSCSIQIFPEICQGFPFTIEVIVQSRIMLTYVT